MTNFWSVNSDESVETASGGVLTHVPRIELGAWATIAKDIPAQIASAKAHLVGKHQSQRAIDIGAAMHHLLVPQARVIGNVEPALYASDELILRQFRARTAFAWKENAWIGTSHVEALMPLGQMLREIGGVRFVWVDFETTLDHFQLGTDLVRKIITDPGCRAVMPEEATDVDLDKIMGPEGYKWQNVEYQRWKFAFDRYGAMVAVNGLREMLTQSGVSDGAVVAGGWMGTNLSPITLYNGTETGNRVSVPGINDSATMYIGNWLPRQGQNTTSAEKLACVSKDLSDLRELADIYGAANVTAKFDVIQHPDLVAELLKHCVAMGIGNVVAWANDRREASAKAASVGGMCSRANQYKPVDSSTSVGMVRTGSAVTNLTSFAPDSAIGSV